MPRDDSPNDQYESLKRQLQDSILNEYPNPERKGCLGDSILKDLASLPFDESLEGDPNWHHVTHCSECYREFLAFRARLKNLARNRGVKVGAGIAAAAIVVGVVAFFALRLPAPPNAGRPVIAQRVFRPRLVDLEGRSMTRSDAGKEQTTPILLQREPEELTIKLPFGSKSGTYEVQLVKNAGHPLVSVTAEGTIQNGTTSLTAKADLSSLEPGNYFIGMRLVPWDWTYYPVVIQ